MTAIPSRPSECANFLLSMLPEEEYVDLRPHLELVPTPLHFKLYERDKRIEYAYFPCSGEHSILATTVEGQSAEVGTVGYEGFSTVDLLMDSETASETTVCQIAGESLRLPTKRFKELVAEDNALRRITLRYLQAYLAMVSQSVACNVLHSIEQRFARWMLMTHDRVHGSEFHLTQEYIAMMLGTHRPTVSVIASTFQRAGILQYRRGVITVLDRDALEDACCECYAITRKQFERFLGGHPSNPTRSAGQPHQ
jgi:CRP-like cAMP-binding protein